MMRLRSGSHQDSRHWRPSDPGLVPGLVDIRVSDNEALYKAMTSKRQRKSCTSMRIYLPGASRFSEEFMGTVPADSGAWGEESRPVLAPRIRGAFS